MATTALRVFQPDDIEIGEHFGSSDTSSVFLAKLTRTGEPVAVKNVTHIQQRELEILKRLRHDNIIRLLGTIDRGRAIMTELVLEYAPDGNLYDFLNDATALLPRYLEWCKQAVCAVAYIHEQNISHRDIKSKNYLVFGDVIKLTDFGLSKIKLDITGTTTQNLGGTFLWMSPEIMDENDDVDHFKSDIYSLGIVFWELYHQQKPYNGWKMRRIIQHVVTNEDHLEIDEQCDAGLRDLMLRCWEYEPSKRPTANEVVTSFSNDVTSSVRKSLSGIGQGRSDTAVYGYWILSFACIVLGVVAFNIFVTTDIIKLPLFEQVKTPSSQPHPVTQPDTQPAPQPRPVTQPDIQPTVQPVIEPTPQPTTVRPTATAPSRDWQKESHRQIQYQKHNKRGTVKVYDRDLKFKGRMEWFKFYSTATDILTGIAADAGGYQSMGGANEHAVENLINKLLAKGVLTN